MIMATLTDTAKSGLEAARPTARHSKPLSLERDAAGAGAAYQQAREFFAACGFFLFFTIFLGVLVYYIKIFNWSLAYMLCLAASFTLTTVFGLVLVRYLYFRIRHFVLRVAYRFDISALKVNGLTLKATVAVTEVIIIIGTLHAAQNAAGNFLALM